MDVITGRISIVAVCVLLTSSGWAGQGAPPATPLTAAQLSAEIGSEADVKAVLALVLRRALKSRAQGQQFFLASQVRSEWLPVIPGMELTRLTEAEIPRHLAACGVYWIISAQRKGDVVLMELKQRCGGSSYRFTVASVGGEWKDPPFGIQHGFLEGIGSGFAGPQPGCACLGR